MAKVKLSPAALRDIELIYNYISIDSDVHAEKVKVKIFQRIFVLEEHPLIGKVVREFNNQSIRELIETPYRIIYKYNNEGEVSVVRIYHSSRLLKKL